MWGHLCTELTNFQNFNVSFSTHKSEVLIHLSQWQYWWWFWFSFFWTFYFFTILRILKHRVFKMNIIINTSFRSRGKWGDYLVTLIPLSWCLNILLNSNFILRMIEWQSESGALIIRIHGKQWYWIYKYDTTSIFTALTLQKNIGHNVWFNFFNKSDNLIERYIQTVFLKNKLTTEQEYWNDVLNKEFNVTSTFNTVKTVLTNKNYKYDNLDLLEFIPNYNINKNINTNNFCNLFNNYKSKRIVYLQNYFNLIQTKNQINLISNIKSSHNGLINDSINIFNEKKKINFFIYLFKNKNLFFYENNTLDDMWEVYSNVLIYNNVQPLRFFNLILNNNRGLIENKNNILNITIMDSNNTVVDKPEENVEYLIIKQKRYKRKQNINYYSIIKNKKKNEFDSIKLNSNNLKTSRFLKNNYIFYQINSTNAKLPFNFYNTIKINRVRAETFSINLTRRLLRTTKTLVLPAYTNISIIANSYDVVHSWFIPGLGLKIDCVPGKSTHHSLYIDNIGLYYGQCAEICGRYHHHMPIRICALPFDHFVIWWTTKGLPKALKQKYNLNSKKIEQSLLLKYSW